MKHRVRKAIQKHIEGHTIQLERPKESSFGHYATNAAFQLAKVRKQSPHLIAKDLEVLFGAEEIFEKVEAVSGFVNFKLKLEFLNLLANEALADEANFGKPSHRDESHERILLEFVSANPTGPLHIGHARGAVFGDTLARIGRHLGHQITTEYYINDAGRQVWLLGLSIWLKGREEILGLKVEWPEEFYRGDYISDLAKEAERELGRAIFEDEEAIRTLSEWGKDKMMDLIRHNLADAGIVFDRFVSEKETFKRWHEVQALLDKHGALYEEDGKIWLATSQKGDEKDRVVVRENGEPTYLAGDIV
ncbi:MAG: arginine--tRNA ligase, partial [Campylobacterales bacterium]